MCTWTADCSITYPVKLFDRDKYIEEAHAPKMGVETAYYKEENKPGS
jgi:hypothetical protein